MNPQEHHLQDMRLSMLRNHIDQSYRIWSQILDQVEATNRSIMYLYENDQTLRAATTSSSSSSETNNFSAAANRRAATESRGRSFATLLEELNLVANHHGTTTASNNPFRVELGMRGGVGGGASPPEDRPLTDEEIARETETIVYDASASNLVESRCPISYDEFVGGEELLCIRRCGHFFKPNALRDWLRRHSRCPMCRFNLSTMMTTRSSLAVGENAPLLGGFAQSDPHPPSSPNQENREDQPNYQTNNNNSNNMDVSNFFTSLLQRLQENSINTNTTNMSGLVIDEEGGIEFTYEFPVDLLQQVTQTPQNINNTTNDES